MEMRQSSVKSQAARVPHIFRECESMVIDPMKFRKIPPLFIVTKETEGVCRKLFTHPGSGTESLGAET